MGFTAHQPPFFIVLVVVLGLQSCVWAQDVALRTSLTTVQLANGFVTLNILQPSGRIVGISYGPLPQVLVERPTDNYFKPPPHAPDTGGTSGPPGGAPTDRGYYDAHWSKPDGTGVYDTFMCTSYKIIEQSPKRATVAFMRPYRGGSTELPANIVIFYSMEAGSSGFYTYSTVEHLPSMPSASLGEFRIVMKLRYQTFDYAVVANDRQRYMPEYIDRSDSNSVPTNIAEARLLTNPRNSSYQYEMEDKYHYVAEMKDQLVYGWISNTSTRVGMWAVNPWKYEYTPGGIDKQDLTVQVGPFLLNYLHSQHIGTPGVSLVAGTRWKKMYGPFFYYFNQASDANVDLWADAKMQAIQEYYKWPYSWASGSDPEEYPIASNRGSVTGQLVIQDPYLDLSTIDLSQAWMGLAAPGPPGSWAYEVYSYQYWVRPVDGSGTFIISNVRAGQYNLYGFVAGVLGDYVWGGIITVTAGGQVNMGQLVFQPPRSGPTLWEIGVPDRDASEFYVPVINRYSPFPYTPSSAESYRNYGSWLAYSSVLPNSDPIFEVGSSDYTRDWWYVHPNRYSPDMKTASPTTFTILFTLNVSPAPTDKYALHFALSGSNSAALQVRINSRSNTPILDTVACNCTLGRSDNGMARSTSHGQYNVYRAVIGGSLLINGQNAIYLTQRRTSGSWIYVMYDYIRLEGPPTLTQ